MMHEILQESSGSNIIPDNNVSSIPDNNVSNIQNNNVTSNNISQNSLLEENINFDEIFKLQKKMEDLKNTLKSKAIQNEIEHKKYLDHFAKIKEEEINQIKLKNEAQKNEFSNFDSETFYEKNLQKAKNIVNATDEISKKDIPEVQRLYKKIIDWARLNTTILRYIGGGLTIIALIGSIYCKYMSLKNIIDPLTVIKENLTPNITNITPNIAQNELLNKIGEAIPKSNTIIDTTKDLTLTALFLKYGTKYVKILLNFIKK